MNTEETIAALRAELAAQETIAALTGQVAALLERINNLEGQRATTSRNSSKPPTGRISVEQILRMAIMELDVQPLRKDWATVLDGVQSAFEIQRTWS